MNLDRLRKRVRQYIDQVSELKPLLVSVLLADANSQHT